MIKAEVNSNEIKLKVKGTILDLLYEYIKIGQELFKDCSQEPAELSSSYLTISKMFLNYSKEALPKRENSHLDEFIDSLIMDCF